MSKIRLSYHHLLFILLMVYSLLLSGSFVLFQYGRERQFKVEELNSSLQLVNNYILHEIADGVPVKSIDLGEVSPFSDIRISVIDSTGHVVYDNSIDSLPGTDHHTREEIAGALRTGAAYTLRRHSESTGNTYFYSATMGNEGMVVRSAVPYSMSLSEFLSADMGFLQAMGAIMLVMCLIGFVVTRRVGNDISIREQRDKEKMRKQLTNNINHELKTPVASIQVCLETIISHKNLSDEKREEFLQRCLFNTERLRRLLADVSLITRMDDGGEAISRETVNLAAIISEVVADTRPLAESGGFTINCIYDKSVNVIGNASLLASVFRNLIDNAIAYSGGDMIEIRQVASDGSKAVFTVTDNGSGIPEEHLPRIFERFYRVDKGRSRSAGGTGLGLSIVKNAVLFHGGAVTVCNLPEGGLSFTITIPTSV